MSLEKINIGILPDDGTGDKVRDAFGLVNDNFVETQEKLDAKANLEHTHIISQIDNLQTILDGLQTSISDLDIELLSKANNDVYDLLTNVNNTLLGIIGSQSEDIESNTSTISDLQDSINEISILINELQDDLAHVGTVNAIQDNSISQLNSSVSQINSNVFNLEQVVNQIIEVNEEQDDNISQLQTDVQVLEQSINQVQNEITNVQDDIQNLVDVNEIQDNSISQINLAIAQINNNIADNINDIDDLQNQIDDIDAGIGGNQDLQSVMDNGKIQDDEYYTFESGTDYDGNSKQFKITLKPDNNFIGMSQSMEHRFNPETGLETNIDFGSESFANKSFSIYGDYMDFRNGINQAYKTLTSEKFQLQFNNEDIYRYWAMDYYQIDTNSDIRFNETYNESKRIFSDDSDLVREVKFTDDNMLSLVNRNYDYKASSQIEMSTDGVYISAADENTRTSFVLNTGGVDISSDNGRLLFTENKSLISNGSNFLGMDFTTYGFVLNDSMFSKGLRGNDYYGNNYDDNTYVQKKYVDDLISSVEPTVPTLQDVMNTGDTTNRSILGTYEIPKSGNRLAFAQIFDIQNAISNYSPQWRNIQGTQSDINLIGFTNGLPKQVSDNFTSSTIPFLTSQNVIAYGADKFVVLGASGSNRRIATSVDGTNWIQGTPSQQNNWSSIAYGNNVFVATTTTGTNRVMTSPDGLNWTNRNAAVALPWSRIKFLNDKFFAIQNNSAIYMTSTDGITWTSRTPMIGTDVISVKYMAYGNGIYVATSDSHTTTYTSLDGINWTLSSSNGAMNVTDTIFGNGVFVVYYSYGSNYRTSSDGINWTSRILPFTISGPMLLEYVNGNFILTSSNGIIRTSVDGITWKTLTSMGPTNCRGIQYNGHFLIALDNNSNYFFTKFDTEKRFENIVNQYQLNGVEIPIVDKILNIRPSLQQVLNVGSVGTASDITMGVLNEYRLALGSSASFVMDGTTNPNINLASKYRVRIYGVSQSHVKSDDIVYLDAPTININQVPSLDNTVTKGLARKSDGSIVEYNLLSNTTAPVSATAIGNAGEIRVTSTYIYTCVATNTWVRAAVATW